MNSKRCGRAIHRVLLGSTWLLACLVLAVPIATKVGSFAETRVVGFELGNPYSRGVTRTVTLGTHQGYGPGYDELASGSLVAARGVSRYADGTPVQA